MPGPTQVRRDINLQRGIPNGRDASFRLSEIGY